MGRAVGTCLVLQRAQSIDLDASWGAESNKQSFTSSCLLGEAESEAAGYTLKAVGAALNPVSVPITLWSGPEKRASPGVCEWLWWHRLLTFKFLLTKDYIGQIVGENLVGTHCWSKRHSKGRICWVLFFLEQFFSEVWAMAGKAFGEWGIPPHVTPSAPELRRYTKHPVTRVSLLNRGCSCKQNLSGQRFMFMLMGSDHG